MQFFLGLVILAKVRILVREAVEALHKVFKDGLLAVGRVQEFKELCLELSLVNSGLLAL
jgi:hypothetical protein